MVSGEVRAFDRFVLGALVVLCLILARPAPGATLEVGEPAPEFKLASTFGTDIALSDFRGKKYVLLEFYGADFAPT